MGAFALSMERRSMKEYLVTAQEMKRYDANTIGEFGMPGLVLMERAALLIYPSCFCSSSEY